jgi:hypothetical protein
MLKLMYVYVYNSKSQKNRTVPLPVKITEGISIQIKRVKEIHSLDIINGF